VEEIKYFKKSIFYDQQRTPGLMPFLHILLYLITNDRCEDTKILDKLGKEIHELCNLPLPIGLLANELIEVID